jgi:hypothetical protein
MRIVAYAVFLMGCLGGGQDPHTGERRAFLHQENVVWCEAQERCGCAAASVDDCAAALDVQRADDANGPAPDDAFASICLDGLRNAWADCAAPSADERGALLNCIPNGGDSQGANNEFSDGEACGASRDCVSGFCSPKRVNPGIPGSCAEGTVRDVVCEGPPAP